MVIQGQWEVSEVATQALDSEAHTEVLFMEAIVMQIRSRLPDQRIIPTVVHTL